MYKEGGKSKSSISSINVESCSRIRSWKGFRRSRNSKTLPFLEWWNLKSTGSIAPKTTINKRSFILLNKETELQACYRSWKRKSKSYWLMSKNLRRKPMAVECSWILWTQRNVQSVVRRVKLIWKITVWATKFILLKLLVANLEYFIFYIDVSDKIILI